MNQPKFQNSTAIKVKSLSGLTLKENTLNEAYSFDVSESEAGSLVRFSPRYSESNLTITIRFRDGTLSEVDAPSSDSFKDKLSYWHFLRLVSHQIDALVEAGAGEKA